MTGTTSPIAQWMDQASAWLLANSEDLSEAQSARDIWAAHSEHSAPVVTLFGAYDSAKSSLLRRLLVDAGQECPEWLTISARHETFEVAPIEVDGLLIRDTPGLAPDADDPRGLENNARALAAAHLTDVLVLVVPPQLATGELDTLHSLLDADWPPGSVMFAITRFDEAGVDPEGDPEGYRARADAKVRELRAALRLSDGSAVHVVAPDAFQIAGEDRQPDPGLWDDFRSWDGIAQLREGLSALKDPSLTLRTAAGLRYFSRQLLATAASLHERQERTKDALVTATQNAQRHDRTLDRLSDLGQEARIKLDAELGTLLDLGTHAGVDDPERLGRQVASVIEQWFEGAGHEVDLLMQDFGHEFERQMDRPGWHRVTHEFEELGRAAVDEDAGPSSETSGERLSTRLREVNASLAKSLQDVRQVWAKRPSDFSAKSRGQEAQAVGNAAKSARGVSKVPEHLVEGGEVVVALGPTIIEIVDMWKEHRRERDEEQARRETLERIEQRLTQLSRLAGDRAFQAFGAYVDEARAVITSSADPLEKLIASLHERETMLSSAYEEAQLLLTARPD